MTATRAISELPGPRGLPGLGNALQIRPSSFHLAVERWAREFGPVYRFRIGQTPIVAFTEPEAMNAILRDRPSGYRRWSVLEEIFKEMGLTGVFTALDDSAGAVEERFHFTMGPHNLRLRVRERVQGR